MSTLMFLPGIGKFPGMPYKFQLKQNAKPARHAPRKVPIHLQDAFGSIHHLYLALSLCVISHIIVSVVISLMYSQVMQRQV